MNFASGLLPDGLYGWTLMSSMPYGKDIPGEVRLLAIHDGVVEYIGEVS
jgi:hypothetical protein